MTSTHTVYMCPKCGSPLVTRSLLCRGVATCGSCTWTGTNEELLTREADIDKDAIAVGLAKDVSALMGTAEFTANFSSLLSKWGFIDISRDKDILVADVVRYLQATHSAVSSALITLITETAKGAPNGR